MTTTYRALRRVRNSVNLISRNNHIHIPQYPVPSLSISPDPEKPSRPCEKSSDSYRTPRPSIPFSPFYCPSIPIPTPLPSHVLVLICSRCRTTNIFASKNRPTHSRTHPSSPLSSAGPAFSSARPSAVTHFLKQDAVSVWISVRQTH